MIEFRRFQDGEIIKAVYLGHVVDGVVESSRVMYGGRLQYSVRLEKPVMFPWRSEPTDFLLIEDKEVIGSVIRS